MVELPQAAHFDINYPEINCLEADSHELTLLAGSDISSTEITYGGYVAYTGLITIEIPLVALIPRGLQQGTLF